MRVYDGQKSTWRNKGVEVVTPAQRATLLEARRVIDELLGTNEPTPEPANDTATPVEITPTARQKAKNVLDNLGINRERRA